MNDGWKREDVLAIDVLPGRHLLLLLHNLTSILARRLYIPEWIELGKELFVGLESPIPYFIGNIFDPQVFDPNKPPEPLGEPLDLFALKDLNVLKGRVTVISADFMFHLFGEKDQERLAEYFALLLSNQPGSSIFGLQRGSENAGIQKLCVFSHYLPLRNK